MYTIDKLRALCKPKTLVITIHAIERLRQRGVTRADVVNAILYGEIIEQYEDRKPFPVCLVLGECVNGKKIHLAVAIVDGFLRVLTVYLPDPSKWSEDFRRRL